MRVLVGCECSGRVRDAFAARGHDAWSCDLQPSDSPGQHLQCDLLTVLDGGWDLMIAHPDCTYLAVSGLHWNGRVDGRSAKTDEALEFVKKLMAAPIERIAIENPISCISTRIRKPDQVIQRWYFGDDASKATCLWLKNLPLLRFDRRTDQRQRLMFPQISDPGHRLPGTRSTRRANQSPCGANKLGPSPLRKKLRSITYAGIANAMADQWG